MNLIIENNYVNNRWGKPVIHHWGQPYFSPLETALTFIMEEAMIFSNEHAVMTLFNTENNHDKSMRKVKISSYKSSYDIHLWIKPWIQHSTLIIQHWKNRWHSALKTTTTFSIKESPNIHHWGQPRHSSLRTAITVIIGSYDIHHLRQSWHSP
jgi:hypothetical protein